MVCRVILNPCSFPLLLAAGWLIGAAGGQEPAKQAVVGQFVRQYCADCHNGKDKKAGLDLETLSSVDVIKDSAAWEKVVRKLTARQMPPAEAPRPKESEYKSVISALEAALDAAATRQPNPGRTPTIRRLTRTEYQNAIRDLLALDIDATSLLPGDEPGHGFDNVAVGDFSPTLLDRYITAAQKISKMAVGSSLRSPGGDTIRIRADLTQEEHVSGLPLGTRGGALIPYNFPQDGEYDIQVRLARDRKVNFTTDDQTRLSVGLRF